MAHLFTRFALVAGIAGSFLVMPIPLDQGTALLPPFLASVKWI